MKISIVLFLMLAFQFQSCGTKNDLKNSLWKYCGSNGEGYVSDILDFREHNYLRLENDTLIDKKTDSVIATIDRIEYYYGERRLFVKDKNGLLARYCEQ